jgi:hypothetical protein
MKKIMVSILIAALMLGLFSVTAFADQWVYDNADLFTDTEEADLEEKSAAFRTETGMDFVILTASDAYSSAMARADDFYDQNGFAADGMLYLIDMYNREAWISTSGEMIYILTDSRISSVFDETNTLLSDGAYYDAAEGVLGICKDYAKSGPPWEAPMPTIHRPERSSGRARRRSSSTGSLSRSPCCSAERASRLRFSSSATATSSRAAPTITTSTAAETSTSPRAPISTSTPPSSVFRIRRTTTTGSAEAEEAAPCIRRAAALRMAAAGAASERVAKNAESSGQTGKKENPVPWSGVFL